MNVADNIPLKNIEATKRVLPTAAISLNRAQTQKAANMPSKCRSLHFLLTIRIM